MKYLLLIISMIVFPLPVLSYISGVDDVDPHISKEIQTKLDLLVTTYYQAPSMEKVNTILDMMTETEVLRKKTAWAPFVGFFTVIFEDNPEHIMQWLSRNNYNTYAIDVLVAALLHAKHKDEAIVFAQAESWDEEQLQELRNKQDNINLKTQPIVLPGHIDTLWGAFFASGDPVYVNNIINVLFIDTHPATNGKVPDNYFDVLTEDYNLAAKTLKYYATSHKIVKEALLKRFHNEKNMGRKRILKSVLPD